MKLIAPGVGWARTGHGLFWTENGGQDWKNITPPARPDEELERPFFLDRSRGWITLNEDKTPTKEAHFIVASTTDAGSTWTQHEFIARPANYGLDSDPPVYGGAGGIAFANSLHGWLNVWFTASPNTWWSFLLLTSDGGRNWKRASNAPALSDAELLAVSSTEGWLYGNERGGGSGLYVTRDGARTWQHVDPQAPGSMLSEVFGLPTFEEDKHGFLQVSGISAKGDASGPTFVLFETLDGGRTWRPDRTLKNVNDRAMRKYGASVVVGSDWIFASVCDHQPRLNTLAMGARIDASAEVARSGETCKDIGHLISFVSPTEGWIVVGDGDLMSTTDGGASWTRISPGPAPIQSSEDPSAL